MTTPALGPVLAAIDVGTNAVRLELARPRRDGSLEIVHQERDPVRPGEGVFKTGAIPREVADRLLSTLRRYAALCRRHARARPRGRHQRGARGAQQGRDHPARAATRPGWSSRSSRARRRRASSASACCAASAKTARSLVHRHRRRLDRGRQRASASEPIELWSRRAGRGAPDRDLRRRRRRSAQAPAPHAASTPRETVERDAAAPASRGAAHGARQLGHHQCGRPFRRRDRHTYATARQIHRASTTWSRSARRAGAPSSTRGAPTSSSRARSCSRRWCSGWTSSRWSGVDRGPARRRARRSDASRSAAARPRTTARRGRARARPPLLLRRAAQPPGGAARAAPLRRAAARCTACRRRRGPTSRSPRCYTTSATR